MKIIVLGAGAIGCWIGAQLARAEHSVTLVGRAPLVQAITERGLQVQFVDGSQWQLDDLHATTTLSHALLRDTAALILCMKAYAIPQAIADLTPFVADLQQAYFVGFQNGFGTDDLLAQAFGSDRVIAATTTTPVSIVAPGVIRVERLDGGIGLAGVERRAWGVGRITNDIVTQLLPSPYAPRPTLYADYRAMRWSKLLLNVIGNASGAILDMPPAQLFADSRLFRLEMRMLREILAVMRAQHIALIDLPGYPARMLARAVRWLPDALLQMLLAKRFARGRGDKRPSFYYDVVSPSRGGQSEIEWLNGAVARAGAACGVSTPVNAVLTQVLMRIVTGQDNSSKWCGSIEGLLEQVKKKHAK